MGRANENIDNFFINYFQWTNNIYLIIKLVSD